MKKARVVLPLTLEQRQLLAGALSINFKSDFLPLELKLELELEPEQADSIGAAARMGINRIVVTKGRITA
jgi:hypothetical protein